MVITNRNAQSTQSMTRTNVLVMNGRTVVGFESQAAPVGYPIPRASLRPSFLAHPTIGKPVHSKRIADTRAACSPNWCSAASTGRA